MLSKSIRRGLFSDTDFVLTVDVRTLIKTHSSVPAQLLRQIELFQLTKASKSCYNRLSHGISSSVIHWINPQRTRITNDEDKISRLNCLRWGNRDAGLLNCDNSIFPCPQGKGWSPVLAFNYGKSGYPLITNEPSNCQISVWLPRLNNRYYNFLS